MGTRMKQPSVNILVNGQEVHPRSLGFWYDGRLRLDGELLPPDTVISIRYEGHDVFRGPRGRLEDTPTAIMDE